MENLLFIKNPAINGLNNNMPPEELTDEEISKYEEAPEELSDEEISQMETLDDTPETPTPEKKGIFRKIGETLISSERGFGESITGAIQPFLKTTKEAEDSGANLEKLRQSTLKLIQEKRKKGEDTSRLLQSLKNMGMNEPTPEEMNPAITKTNKQVAGEGLGVLADIASFGTYGTAAKGAQAGKFLPTMKLSELAVPTAKTGIGAFGKGFVSGAVKNAPIGIAYGVSGAMQENKDFQEIVSEGVRGGVFNAILGGLIEGRGAQKAFNRPAKAEALKREAIQRYKIGLGASKEKYKDQADKIIPKLLDEKTWGTRRALIKKAEKGMQMSGEEYEKLGELTGLSNTGGLFTAIHEAQEKLKVNGKILSINQGKYNALTSLEDDLLAVTVIDSVGNPKAVQENLRKVADAYGTEIYESRKSIKTIQDSKVLSQVKELDDEIIGLLATDNPTYAKINKVYSLNKKLSGILTETAKRESSGLGVQKVKELVSAVGGLVAAAGAGATQGAVTSVLSGIAGSIAMGSLAVAIQSTWWNTLRAVQKAKLADKLLAMPPEQRNQTVVLLAREGYKLAKDLIAE